MLKVVVSILIVISPYFINSLFALTPLEECWSKQASQLKDHFFDAKIIENKNNLSHSMNPWEVRTYNIEGKIWLNNNRFLKSDTLTTSSGKEYYSKSQWENDNFLFIDYGDDDLSEVTKSKMQKEFVISARYSPVLILDYFYKHKIPESIESSERVAIFRSKIYDYEVSLHIDRKKLEVIKVETISALLSDDQYYGFGDVKDVYEYSHYTSTKTLSYPRNIRILKLNGNLKDEVSLSHVSISREMEPLLKAPMDYKMEEDVAIVSDITTEKYSENIYFINLHHCGTRSLMVEFSDFVLVAESPLNSTYGEELLNEVKKIAPNKPIKYFAFGHFHPHYTGGIRPFIHQGAKIICVEEDKSYVEFIANSAHTILRDSLEIDPKETQFDFIKDEKVISDGSYEMSIYHIGSKSNHTNDYLIYYFPEEKLIFQDDLVSLMKNTTKDNISKTTMGLYTAIKDLGIEVNEIAQNWSVFNKENRMVFKFRDIEEIIKGN